MNRENDIIRAYRERKDEFHLPLPEEGWKKLEADLAYHPSVRHFPSRWWLTAAVAVLCVLFSVPLFMPEEDIIQDEKTATVTAGEQLPVNKSRPEPEKPLIAEAPFSGEKGFGQKKPPVIAEEKKEDVSDREEGEISIFSGEESEKPEPEEEPVYTEASEPPAIQSKQIPPTSSARSPAHPEASRKRKSPTSQRWSFGLLAGSYSFGSEGADKYYIGFPTDPGEEDPEKRPDKQSVRTKGKLLTRSDADTRYSHRIPLSAGLRAAYHFTDRLALESGLSYTYLSSELKRDDMKAITGNQKIHYLGLPVKVNWNFYSNRLICIYLTGGGMLEYCLSAQQEFGGQKQSLDINRWQWSLQSGIGIQLALVPPVSLFVEPGVSYYFPPGNTRGYETMRTKHPFDFSLQLGFRFSY